MFPSFRKCSETIQVVVLDDKVVRVASRIPSASSFGDRSHTHFQRPPLLSTTISSSFKATRFRLVSVVQLTTDRNLQDFNSL